MAKKEISEYDTDMFFLITDDNTNLTEINSINNNHNVTLINDYLVVQAISVSSEQIFSVAKHTISPTRNRLSTENIRASLCLNKNHSKNQYNFNKYNYLIILK